MIFVSKRVKKTNPGHKKMCPARDIKYRKHWESNLVPYPKWMIFGGANRPEALKNSLRSWYFQSKSKKNGDESCSWAPKKWASGDPYPHIAKCIKGISPKEMDIPKKKRAS